MARRSYEGFFDGDFLARLQALHLLSKRLAGRRGGGAQRSRRLGDGLEFADHRAYSPGDDVRFIDWPYYARMEKLLLRMFHEHSEAEVAILLDCSASMAPGGQADRFRYALRTAAALAYVAMGSLQRVTIQPFADELAEPMRAGRSRVQVLDVLDYLAGLSAGGPTALGRCVDRFARRAEPSETVLLVSDLLGCGDDLSDALARLRLRSCDAVVVHLYSPAEADPDLAGPVLLAEAESDRRLSLNVTPELLDSYRRRWREFQSACERTAVGRGAVYVAASTGVPFERLVLQTLRQAGVLAG